MTVAEEGVDDVFETFEAVDIFIVLGIVIGLLVFSLILEFVAHLLEWVPTTHALYTNQLTNQ